MPHLTIEYKGRTVFDGEVAELEIKETDSAITVKGRTGAAKSTTGLGALAEALAKAAQQRQTPPAAAAPEPVEPDEIQVPTPAKTAAAPVVDMNGQQAAAG